MDFLSQIFCSKFEEGLLKSEEEEEHDQMRNVGVYKMISDLKDEMYKTPLNTLKEMTKTENKGEKDINLILWWISFIGSSVLTFLYIVGMYFTYWDDP